MTEDNEELKIIILFVPIAAKWLASGTDDVNEGIYTSQLGS